MAAAALNQRPLPHGAGAPFAHGDLLHQFGKGGVLEQTPIPEFQLLSIQDILRTENHLGHTTDNIHEIDFALLNRTNKQNDFHEHEVFQYSQKETGREQNGGSADADVATGTGHMKRGIQDPDAFNKIEAKKTRRTIAFLQELEAQRAALEALNQKIAELEAHLKELDLKLEELNNKFQDMNETMEFLEAGGDLNDGSPRAARAKRALNAAAIRQGITEDQYKHADGTYNNEAAADIIKKEQEVVAEKIIVVQEDIIATEDKLITARDERRAISQEIIDNPETPEAERAAHNNLQETDTQAIQNLEVQKAETSSSMDKMKAFLQKSKATIVSFYDSDDSDTELANNTAEDSSIDETQEQLIDVNNDGTSNPNDAVSFAASEDGSVTNVIKASFNDVSDPALAQEKLDKLAASQTLSSEAQDPTTPQQDSTTSLIKLS